MPQTLARAVLALAFLPLLATLAASNGAPAPPDSNSAARTNPSVDDQNATFKGRLIDAATGAPIAGAKIVNGPALRQHLHAQKPQTMRAPRKAQAISDADGRFQVPVSTEQLTRLDVFADGYSVRRAEIGGSKDAEGLDAAADIELTAERVLTVTAEGSTIGLRVRLAHGLWQRLRDDGLRPAVFDLSPVLFQPSGLGDPDSFVFRGLPTRGTATILFQRGSETIHAVDFVSLEGPPGERHLKVDLTADRVVEGRVLREDGSPVAQQEIWIGPAERAHSAQFSPLATPRQTTKTDDQGRFRFEGLIRARYLVAYPPGPITPGAPRPTRACKGSQVDLRSTSETPRIDLLELEGLTIRGVLLDPDGKPTAGVVTAILRGSPLTWEQSTIAAGSDGTYVLGPLIPGTYGVSSMGGGPESYGHSTKVVAEAGAKDINVQLRRTTSVRGTIARGSAPAEDVTRIRLIDQRTGNSWGEETQGSSSFAFEGVTTGEMHLFARTEDGWASDLVPVHLPADGSAKEVAVELKRGGLVKLTATGGIDRFRCHVKQGGLSLYFDDFSEGQSANLSVPTGPVEITVFSPGTRAQVKLELDIAAGDVLEHQVELVETQGS